LLFRALIIRVESDPYAGHRYHKVRKDRRQKPIACPTCAGAGPQATDIIAGKMDIRPYTPADHAACLAVFDSNTPWFFDPSERRKFETFLDAPFCSYFVMEHDGAVVGCGGYAIEENSLLASLVWGMVRNDLHKRGLGRFLVMFRLREITKTSGAQMVRLGTSQRTARFFEKQGFKVAGIEKNGYASGIDRVEMRMKLSVCP
jgi:ribosomal protein S18 acetylase RimI-like enzyme